jgi:hypothetical protein
METSQQFPQRIEDRKTKKLMERIEKMRVVSGKDIRDKSAQSTAPKQQCPNAA